MMIENKKMVMNVRMIVMKAVPYSIPEHVASESVKTKIKMISAIQLSIS